MWTEAELSWSDFLPKDEDINKFVTDQVSKQRYQEAKTKQQLGIC